MATREHKRGGVGRQHGKRRSQLGESTVEISTTGAHLHRRISSGIRLNSPASFGCIAS